MSECVKRIRWCWVEIRRFRLGPVLQTSRQVAVFLPGVMSPAKCVACFGFMILYRIIQQAFLLRAVHFITWEERVSHIFLFCFSLPFVSLQRYWFAYALWFRCYSWMLTFICCLRKNKLKKRFYSHAFCGTVWTGMPSNSRDVVR